MTIPVIVIVIFGLMLLFQIYPSLTHSASGLLIIGILSFGYYLGKKKGNIFL